MEFCFLEENIFQGGRLLQVATDCYRYWQSFKDIYRLFQIVKDCGKNNDRLSHIITDSDRLLQVVTDCYRE